MFNCDLNLRYTRFIVLFSGNRLQRTRRHLNGSGKVMPLLLRVVSSFRDFRIFASSLCETMHHFPVLR